MHITSLFSHYPLFYLLRFIDSFRLRFFKKFKNYGLNELFEIGLKLLIWMLFETLICKLKICKEPQIFGFLTVSSIFVNNLYIKAKNWTKSGLISLWNVLSLHARVSTQFEWKKICIHWKNRKLDFWNFDLSFRTRSNASEVPKSKSSGFKSAETALKVIETVLKVNETVLK